MFRRSAVMTCIVVTSIVVCNTVVQAGDNTVKLKEVVVTATKTEKQPQDVTQPVTVITADEIGKSGAATVGDLLAATTAATVNRQGPLGSLTQIKLRGSSSEQVLVLLDGMRMNSMRSGGFDLSEIPVPTADIERIEIIRGPASALYGADAVGGVVNIITKKPAAASTTISGSVGQYQSSPENLPVHHRWNRNFALRNTGKQGSVYYVLTAEDERSPGYRINSKLKKQDAGLKIGYEFSPDSSAEVWTNYLNKELGVSGMTMAPTPNAEQLSRDFMTGVSYKVRLAQSADITINVSDRKNKLNYKDPDSFPALDSTHKTDTKTADAQLSILAGSWNAFTAGGETRRDNLDSTESGSHAATLRAFYLQDEISIGDSLIVVAGVRNDKHSVYGSRWSPKASGRYLIASSGTIIRASYGESFRAPTFNDLYWPNSSSTYWGITYITEGNPALRPEKAKEYEGGIEQQLGKKSAIILTGFKRKVKDLIQWEGTYSPTIVQFQPRNVGRARISGYEAEAKFTLSDTVQWKLNYIRLFPVDEATGQRIISTASPMADAQAGTSFMAALDKQTVLALDGHWIRNYVAAGQPRWQYYVVNGKITDTVASTKNMKTDVFLGMNNMFNRKYEVSKGYPMPPQQLYGGVSLTY
jgi:vitamin B12 transporter